MQSVDNSTITRRAFLHLCGLAWLSYQATGLDKPILARLPTNHPSDEPQLVAPYTFDSFVVSPHNRAAFEAAWAVAHEPSYTFNPLFIHGATGLGKTHLLLALGQHLSTSNSGRRVLYMPATSFAHLVDKALVGASATRLFCERFRQADVILIDDLHRLTDETACDFVSPDSSRRITGAVAQNALRDLFDEMYEPRSKLFVFASIYAPHLLPGMGRPLVQRCSRNMVEEIRCPF